MSNNTTFSPPAEAMEIAKRLHNAGHQALFCGGAVRDLLLGVQPKDYDIATSALPEEVEQLFPKTIAIGKAYGIIVVVGEDGGHYEVATFRSDLTYVDGRRPEGVRFSSPLEDAKRRDFTMNALFFDPFTERVVDLVGGIADMENGILRTVGVPAKRFAEDKLRLLRAIRFAARTGFTIERETWSAIKSECQGAAKVAPERLASELELMLTGGYAADAFSLLKNSGILKVVLPEVDRMDGVEQPPDFHPEGNVWVHTLLLLEEMDKAINRQTDPLDYSTNDVDPERGMTRGDFNREEYLLGVYECWDSFDPFWRKVLCWSALLHDIGKPDTYFVSDRIRFNDHDRLGADMATSQLERLKRPRKVIEGVHDLIHRHIHFSTLRKMRKSKLRRWLAAESFPAHLELHRLDCISSHGMLANWFFGLEAWREEKARPPEPEPLLRGGDLIAMGYAAGPMIGTVLKEVEDARLEGTLVNREQALAFAEKRRDDMNGS